MENALAAFNLQNFVIQVVAMAFTALALPRLRVTSIFGPIMMVLALGAINIFYWDESLFGFIPTTLNLRIFALFLVNGVIFWALVKLLPGIEVDGILPALVAPIIFSLLSILIQKYSPLIPWQEIYETALALLGQLKTYFTASD